METKSRLFLWVLAHCAVVLLCLAPLLTGSFLFDDSINLKALGEYGPVQDFAGLARYLTAGIADPLGRPVAMASFLLDARDWPAEPASFLRTNLLLHLCNSLLLYHLLTRLALAKQLVQPAGNQAALAAATLWALHPLWISTVGYVVQRHAMLATTFVLLGLVVWLLAVAEFRLGRASRGWLWAFLAIPVCGLLAVLSKANGALLPLLALTVHFFWLGPAESRSLPERLAVRLFLAIPSLILVLGLLLLMELNPEGRSWSLGERLLSQPRALADYLFQLLLPRVNSTGLFADGFQVSTTWLNPITTTPAALTVLALIALPVLIRKKHPALATAVAFFFAGHVMESTVLPLELYFEHRNYLPSVLLGWPLALGLLSNPSGRAVRRTLLFGLIAVLAFIAHQRAVLWADPPRQAAQWAMQHPDSPRAQTWAAQNEIDQSRLPEARHRLALANRQLPENAMLAFNLLNAECLMGDVQSSTLKAVEYSLAQWGTGKDITYTWLRDKVVDTRQSCPELDAEQLTKFLEAAGPASQGSPIAQSRQVRLEGLQAISLGDCGAAQSKLMAAQRLQKHMSEAYSDAALLASHCGPSTGIDYLNAFSRLGGGEARMRAGMPRLHQRVLEQQMYWNLEIAKLRSSLETEARSREKSAPERSSSRD